MSRIGLVLGAGGVVGQAYHSGVLTMLEHDFGWDARSAEILVGTSAGSITATLLRCGVPASELAAWTVRAPLSPEGRVLEEMLGDALPELEPLRTSHFLRPMTAPGWDMLRHAAARPWHFRPLAAALAMLAPGKVDIVRHLGALGRVDGGAWPAADLWICAVRRRDGRRVVFGRPGAPDAPLHLAVAASCAVPGYFTPVEIGGHSYVDGGAHSPTNAAVLRARCLDLVIVVSPMSGPAPYLPTNLYAASRRHAARLLSREVRALRAGGVPVVVFRPGPAEQATMGDDFLSRDRVDAIVRKAFLGAGQHAAQPEIRELLADVCRATTPGTSAVPLGRRSHRACDSRS